jgi:hypothetical protein
MAQTKQIERVKIAKLSDVSGFQLANRRKLACIIAPCEKLSALEIKEVEPLGSVMKSYSDILGSGLAYDAAKQIFETEAGFTKAPDKLYVMGVNKSVPSTFSTPAWSDGAGGTRTGDANIFVFGKATLTKVLDRTLATPPVTPTTGDRYIISATATGDWLAHENKIAEWNGTSWVFTTPSVDDIVLVANETLFYKFNGTSWASTSSGDLADPVGDHNYTIRFKTVGQTNAASYDLYKDGVKTVKDATVPVEGSSIAIEAKLFFTFVDAAASFASNDEVSVDTTGAGSTTADYIEALTSKELESNAHNFATALVLSKSGFSISFMNTVKTIAEVLDNDLGWGVLFVVNQNQRGIEDFPSYTDTLQFDNYDFTVNQGGSRWICATIDYNEANGMSSACEIVGKIIRVPVSESIGKNDFADIRFSPSIVDQSKWAEVETDFVNTFAKIYFNKTLRKMQVYNASLLVPKPPDDAKIRITTVPDIRTIQETELWIKYWFEMDMKETKLEASISAIQLAVGQLKEKVLKSMAGELVDLKITPATYDRRTGVEVASLIESELATNNQVYLLYEVQGYSHVSKIPGFLSFQKSKL